MKKQKQKKNIIRSELNPKWETCCPTLFWRAKKSEKIFELETFFELADYDWRQADKLKIKKWGRWPRVVRTGLKQKKDLRWLASTSTSTSDDMQKIDFDRHQWKHVQSLSGQQKN